MRRLLITICLGAAVALSSQAPALAAPPRWVQRVDRLIGERPMSVMIGFRGETLYRHRHLVRRPPASNEKLLLSMALLQRVGEDETMPTRVLGTRRAGPDGGLEGDLWIVGHGDPEIDARDMAALARALIADGLERVHGRVLGSTGPYARDWFAPGWREYFPRYYIALPTALTYRFNELAGGRHVANPERLAARALTKKLEARGVRVSGRAGSGRPPKRLVGLATVRSDPLGTIMRRMNLISSNFRAEVLGKMLAAKQVEPPSTIAKAATVIERFTEARGVHVTAHDASGLSYGNRVSAAGIVRLLQIAERAPWGETLRGTLPAAGEGTLHDRLAGVTLRAKTGTLIDVSALSGWVWLEREDDWAEFSILSSGMDDGRAKHIENGVVRVVAANAGPR